MLILKIIKSSSLLKICIKMGFWFWTKKKDDGWQGLFCNFGHNFDFAKSGIKKKCVQNDGCTSKHSEHDYAKKY